MARRKPAPTLAGMKPNPLAKPTPLKTISWKRTPDPTSAREQGRLSPEEDARVRFALDVLRARYGGEWKAVAAALKSNKRQILRYVAANKPIEQTKVETALAHLGANTVRQALYDMTSVKSGLLERTETGLIPSKKGLEALNSAA